MFSLKLTQLLTDTGKYGQRTLLYVPSHIQQQQQQHFISPHNIQEIKIYNNSTDNDRGAGCPK